MLADAHRSKDGDRVCGQNYVGFARRSIGRRGSARSAAFLPVGFYYRAFFRPHGAWRFWEPIIRRMAGLGRVDPAALHGYYDKAYLFADVAVVGGGPAGLSAAIAAARTGKEVVVIDENPTLGGALNYARFDAAGAAGRRGTRRRWFRVRWSASTLPF